MCWHLHEKILNQDTNHFTHNTFSFTRHGVAHVLCGFVFVSSFFYLFCFNFRVLLRLFCIEIYCVFCFLLSWPGEIYIHLFLINKLHAGRFVHIKSVELECRMLYCILCCNVYCFARPYLVLLILLLNNNYCMFLIWKLNQYLVVRSKWISNEHFERLDIKFLYSCYYYMIHI